MPKQRRRHSSRQNRLDDKVYPRRVPRRDLRTFGVYTPMVVNPQAARRGVQSRLAQAVLGCVFTFVCIGLMVGSQQAPFGVVWLFSLAFCSVSLVVASLLSARREEAVHRLACELVERPLLEMRSDGADGAVSPSCGDPGRDR